MKNERMRNLIFQYQHIMKRFQFLFTSVSRTLICIIRIEINDKNIQKTIFFNIKFTFPITLNGLKCEKILMLKFNIKTVGTFHYFISVVF